MIDDLDGDAPGLRCVKGTGGVAVEGGPGLFVDLGFEGGFQGAVGIVGTEEVGVADEEALFVVVGVDEPAGDAVGAVAADFARLRVEHVHTVNLDANLVAFGVEDLDVRLAEDDEEVALAGILQVVGHVEVGVHARLEHGDAAEFCELGGVRLIVEGAGDQHVKVGVAGLSGSSDQIGAGNGAELCSFIDIRTKS